MPILKSNQINKYRKEGFTLVELIFVITISAILAAISIPSLIKLKNLYDDPHAGRNNIISFAYGAQSPRQGRRTSQFPDTNNYEKSARSEKRTCTHRPSELQLPCLFVTSYMIVCFFISALLCPYVLYLEVLSSARLVRGIGHHTFCQSVAIA